MIRRVEHHGRLRSLGADIRQREEYTGRRVAVSRLKEYRAVPPAIQLHEHVMAMVVRGHRDCTSQRRYFYSSIQRVLKHRTCTDECAVLLRLGPTQPAMHQRSQPRAFTACQNDRPELI